MAITLGFAANEAAHDNYADAMEAIEGSPTTGAEHLLSWARAVVYGAAARWTEVIEEVRSAGKWPDTFLAAAAGVAHGVAAAIIEVDPGPEYIRAELISGGNAPKSMAEPSVVYSAAAALAASAAAYDPALVPSVFTNIS